jgi:hypothetical protein
VARGGVTVGPRCVGGGSERWCGRWRQRRCASGGGGEAPCVKVRFGGCWERLRRVSQEYRGGRGDGWQCGEAAEAPP